MGLDEFDSSKENKDDKSGDEKDRDDLGVPKLNESKEHSSTKKEIKNALENDGQDVNTEYRLKFENGDIFIPDIFAEITNEDSKLVKSANKEDVIAVEIGNVTSTRLVELTKRLDHVWLIPKGGSIHERATISINKSSIADQEKLKYNTELEMTDSNRRKRKRGPYMDAEAYERLKKASEEYDMSVKDTIDKLMLDVINEEGRVKEPHSVLRNKMNNEMK